jgi:hypothetical protein
VPAAVRAPQLRVVTVAPLHVAGSGFAPSERVSITLTIGAKRRATIWRRATAAGAFSARFSPLIATDVCRGLLTVRAVGATGSRATVRHSRRTPDPLPPS